MLSRTRSKSSFRIRVVKSANELKTELIGWERLCNRCRQDPGDALEVLGFKLGREIQVEEVEGKKHYFMEGSYYRETLREAVSRVLIR